MPYFLITFSNTHAAISTQKFLNGKINFCIMPTLRELSQSCGISIRINLNELDKKPSPNESALPLFQYMKEQPLSFNLYQIYYIENNFHTPIQSPYLL